LAAHFEAADANVRSNARIVGSLVHRLLERQIQESRRELLLELAAGLLRPDERIQQADWQPVVETAVDRYRALVERPDICGFFAEGRRWHEVPVSVAENGQRIRGTIDTLILLDPADSPARALVLEFKTGAPLPWHQTQLDQYVAAARELLRDRRVDGTLIYSGSEQGSE
jgi:PD-(D/E)XK nuclease superfamily